LSMRLFFGLLRPKHARPGVDVAGRVEAAGKGVTRLKPGDEVFGSCRGAFAEYVCTPESALVVKPGNVTFEQAASAPVAAYTALQGLRDKGQVRPGQKVLVNGAAGGVGTFAVQIARWLGAEVTGVCSTRNLQMVRSLGADRVIDYSREDFTRTGERYDVVFDCIANRSPWACRRALKPGGRCVLVGASHSRWAIPVFAPMFLAVAMSAFMDRKLTPFMAKRNREDLEIIGGLMGSGKLRPVIDRRYRLGEVPEAMRFSKAGHTRGKIVITVEDA